MFSRKMFIRKNDESTFSQKVSIFSQESADASSFWTVFAYFFLRLGISDSKEHSCQISAQMNNVERF